MNSYTINIADFELNIRCALSEEDLNATAEKVDTCIREICSKSSNVSKTEAAILCALEYCSIGERAEESIGQNDDEREELEEENKKASAAISKLESRLETQKEKSDATIAALKERYDANTQAQKEKYEGRIENMKNRYETRIAQLKAKLDEAKETSAAAEATQQMSMAIPETHEEEAKETETVIEEKTEEAKTDKPAEDTEKSKNKSRSKVGSMFELLTFGDV